jgi:hypothetical protein
MLSKVAPEDWDAPEHLSLSERDFLVTRAEAIHGIVAKSYLDVGRVLLQVKRKFKNDPELKGWFTRWCSECLPSDFAQQRCTAMIRIAEEAEEREDLRELIQSENSPTWSKLYRILCLPDSAKEALLDQLKEGEKLSQDDIDGVRKIPEVELERIQESVDALQNSLLKYQLQGLTGGALSSTKKRLAKALDQLAEKQREVDSLGKSQTTQEAVLAQLKRQLKQQEVQIEEINLDPEQKRKRSLAKTVVDATTSLDLLLSAFDRYGTDKPELGAAAIKTIERKMAQVQQRLQEHYAKEAI